MVGLKSTTFSIILNFDRKGQIFFKYPFNGQDHKVVSIRLRKRLLMSTISTFDDILKGPVLATAKKLYKAPTEIQKEVIPIAVAGKDVVAMSKTGSGKTAAFLFPLIQKLKEHSKITGCRALIVSPTRDLSLQTGRFFKQYSENTDLKYASIIGDEPLPPQFEALTQNPDVIICTPGRILQIIAETSYSLSRVEILVIDEADQLFEKGLGEQLQAILQLLPKNKPQLLLFSATIPQMLAEFAKINLKNAIPIRLDISKLPETLKFEFKKIAPTFKPALLMNIIKNYKNSLVFVGTRHHAEFLSALANCLGVRSGCIYGQMDQDERNSSLASFARGSKKILFVSDVAARGLDIEGLDLVLNYDFPPEPKIFLHRSGRAGRAGKEGTVISFVTQDELPYFAGAMDTLSKSNEWKIVSVSSEEIKSEIVQVDDAMKRESNLKYLFKGMEDGEKNYIKSRPAAKPYWISLSKQLTIGSSESKIEDELLKWRPKATIFEMNPQNQKQLEIMKGINLAHEGHKTADIIKKKQEEEKAEEEAKEELHKKVEEEKRKAEELRSRQTYQRKERPAKPKPVQEKKQSEFFLDPSKYLKDVGKTRDYNIASLQEKVINLTPDDQSSFQFQKNLIRKDKKKQNAKALLNMEKNKEFLRSAVSKLTDTTPRGEKYLEWVQQSNMHIQEAGQEEKIMKAKKKGKFGKSKSSNVKSELKTPEQIERDRLIKLKHKLNDQGKHKEAAMLNQKIYKHKRGRK